MLLSGRQLSGEYPKVGFTQVSTCFACFIELRQNTTFCYWLQSKILSECDHLILLFSYFVLAQTICQIS